MLIKQTFVLLLISSSGLSAPTSIRRKFVETMLGPELQVLRQLQEKVGQIVDSMKQQFGIDMYSMTSNTASKFVNGLHQKRFWNTTNTNHR